MRPTSAGTATRVHLIDLQTVEGKFYYWADRAVAFVPAALVPAVNGQGLVNYTAWLHTPPTLKRNRALAMETGSMCGFVFAWQNNAGPVTQESTGWYRIPLASGKTLAWAGFEIYDAGLMGTPPANHSAVSTPLTTLGNGVIPLPSGFTSVTLQTVTGPTSFQVVDHPTHGIRDCYVTSNLQSLSSFEDGEGHLWYGTAGVFCLPCDPAWDLDGDTEQFFQQPFQVAAQPAHGQLPGRFRTPTRPRSMHELRYI